MVFVVGVLTFLMVLDCLLLVMLVLIQLPKKEAGVGVAFGGAATDALFGAGSGNVLTKATKYMAGGFFVLALVLSVLQTRLYHSRTSEFQKELERTQQAPPPLAAPPAASSQVPAAPNTTTGMNLLLPPGEDITNTLPPPASAPGMNLLTPNAAVTNPAPATPPE